MPRPPRCAAPRATAMRRVRSFLPPAPPVGVSPCGLVWIAALKEMLRLRLRTKARWRRRTPGPGKARANRSTSFRRLSRVLLAAPIRKKCSATHEAREKGEPACAAEGSVYEPPAALIAAWLERVRGNTVRRKRRTRFLPSRENSALELDANQRKRGVVSVCRLWRNQAGRAARVGESWPLFPALLWTAAIAW